MIPTKFLPFPLRCNTVIRTTKFLVFPKTYLSYWRVREREYSERPQETIHATQFSRQVSLLLLWFFVVLTLSVSLRSATCSPSLSLSNPSHQLFHNTEKILSITIYIGGWLDKLNIINYVSDSFLYLVYELIFRKIRELKTFAFNTLTRWEEMQWMNTTMFIGKL